jgi:hypothetical protein
MRSASAHCCSARRYWPCMAASTARGQCKSGSVAAWARPVSSEVSAPRHLPVENRAAARSHLATVMPGLSLSPVRNVVPGTSNKYLSAGFHPACGGMPVLDAWLGVPTVYLPNIAEKA